MKHYIITLFLLIWFSSGIYAGEKRVSEWETQAVLDFKKLVNYSKLNEEDSINFISQRISQLNQQDRLMIPRRFQIPAELMSYRREGEHGYFIRYNTRKNTSIAYVPSDLVYYYEAEAWSDFKKNGENSPLLSIVLAQQFTESGFDPNRSGDGGKSVGLPQLHLPTAKWIYSADKELWENYIYWDGKGLHHFKDIQAQIKFPYEFLPRYKKYSANAKFEGLRRYNGAGEHAEFYAKLVLRRSIVYLELMQQYNYYKEDTSNLVDKIACVINMGLENRGEKALTKQQILKISGELMSEFSRNWNYVNVNRRFSTPFMEGKQLNFNLSEHYKVPSDGKAYFIMIEEGRSLFSYFHNTDEMLHTINDQTNPDYFCFYWNRGRKVKIYSKADLIGKTYFSNVVAGDLINIPAGTKLYSPNANLIAKIEE